jgi:hypothetical protein
MPMIIADSDYKMCLTTNRLSMLSNNFVRDGIAHFEYLLATTNELPGDDRLLCLG